MNTIKNLIIILMITMSTMYAQIDRTKVPQEAKTPKFSLPKIQKAVLSNGLKIMLVEYRKLPIIQMQFVFQSGTTSDPVGKSGLANLTIRLIDAGTQTRDIMQIADEFSFIGTRFSASTSYDGSFISVMTLNKHIDKTLELTSDILKNAIFPVTEFERVKKEILTSLLQQKDRPEVIANKMFSKIVYGEDHPYGNATDGTDESVKNISIDDVKEFFSDHFRPDNATLIVVGDTKLKLIKNLLEKYFSDWQPKPTQHPNIPFASGLKETGIFMVDKAKAAQSQIRIGSIGVERSNPDYFALEVMNMILGGNFNSRINWNLREQKGYTYGARSGFSFRKAAGPFVASGGFKSSATDTCVSELIGEIRRMRETDITPAELVFAKNSLIRALPRSFETLGQIASQLANLVLYNLPNNYYDTYIKNIEKVTIKDVRRVSEKYLHPDKMAIVIVGDIELNKSNLEKLNIGKINILDASGKIIE